MRTLMSIILFEKTTYYRCLLMKFLIENVQTFYFPIIYISLKCYFYTKCFTFTKVLVLMFTNFSAFSVVYYENRL